MLWYILLCFWILNMPICHTELHARRLNTSFVKLDTFYPYEQPNEPHTTACLYISQTDNNALSKLTQDSKTTETTSTDVFIPPTIIFGSTGNSSFATLPGPQTEHRVCYIVSSNPALYENDLAAIYKIIFSNITSDICHNSTSIIRLSTDTANPNLTAESILFNLYRHLQGDRPYMNNILVLVCSSPQDTSSLVCDLIKLYTQYPFFTIQKIFVITPDLCYIPSSLLQTNNPYILFHRLPHIDEWTCIIDNTIISPMVKILNRPIILHKDALLYCATHPILQNILLGQTLVCVKGNVSFIADLLWNIAKQKIRESTPSSNDASSLHIELADIIEHCLYSPNDYFDPQHLSTLYKIESYHDDTIKHYYNHTDAAPLNTYQTYICYDCQSGRNFFSAGNILTLTRLKNTEEAIFKNLSYVEINNIKLWYVADDINIMNIKNSLIAALSAVERYRTEKLPNISVSTFATHTYMLSVIPHHVPAIFYETIYNPRNIELSLAILLCAPLLNINTTSIVSMGMLDSEGNISGTTGISTDLEQAMNLLYDHKNPIIIATKTHEKAHTPNIPTTYLSKYKILYASHINEVFEYLQATLPETNSTPMSP